MSYATKPRWALDYMFRERFSLPNLEDACGRGQRACRSRSPTISTRCSTSRWTGKRPTSCATTGAASSRSRGSCRSATRSARRRSGSTRSCISNHGGRQLDGSRAPFDQLAEIVDAVGDKVEVILDGGVRRGTHVLKALSVGAKAVSGGRLYLYALAAAGEAGVERAVGDPRERDRARHEADGGEESLGPHPRESALALGLRAKAGSSNPSHSHSRAIMRARHRPKSPR